MRTIDFIAYQPAPRYDDVLIVSARIEHSASIDGPWTTLETQALPVYMDPAAPPPVNITSSIPDDAVDDWFRLVFIGDDASEDITDPVNLPRDAYPDAASLRALSSGPARQALDELSNDQLGGLWSSSVMALEEFCGQSFADTEVLTRLFDGNGSDRLYLDRRLQRLDAVLIDRLSLPTSRLLLDDEHASLRLLSNVVSGNYYERSIASIDPDMRRHQFRAGRGNIEITGLWGWGSVPEAVKLALRYDMEDVALADASTLSATIHAYRRLGLRDISQGNLRATLLDAPSISLRAQRVLAAYAWRPHGLAI